MTQQALSDNVQRMKSQIITMLEMQDAMNSRVNAQWRSAGNAWYRAVWTECAEMLDHYGWKWWKHQQADIDQVQLELVDIFHFAMSETLISTASVDEAAELIGSAMQHPAQLDDIRVAIEQMALHTLADQRVDYSAFANIMALVEMSFDELYRLYVGKNVLNFFRQDHGYKDGSYIKVWHGQEDNEHLSSLLRQLDSTSETFSDDIYQGLEQAYPGS